MCELQCILREAFAAIVEKEMKEAYDELWLVDAYFSVCRKD